MCLSSLPQTVGTGVGTLHLAAPGCCSDSPISALAAHGPPCRATRFSLSVNLYRLRPLYPSVTWQLHAICGAIAAAPIPHMLPHRFQGSRRQRRPLLLMRRLSFLGTFTLLLCSKAGVQVPIVSPPIAVSLCGVQRALLPLGRGLHQHHHLTTRPCLRS